MRALTVDEIQDVAGGIPSAGQVGFSALVEQTREALYRLTVRLDAQQIVAYGEP